MYGILIGISVIICILVSEKFIKNKKIPISTKEFWDLVTIIFFLSILGGRVYHCLDNYQYYLLDPIRVIYIWNGGFGIFGSIILILLFLYFYCKKHNKNIFIYLDLLTFFAPGIQIAGRVGNLFNNELMNSSIEIVFLGFLLGLFLIKNKEFKFGKGLVTAIYLIIYAFARIFTENFRNPVYSFHIMSINITYVISLFMLLAGFGIIIFNKFNNRVKS